LPRKPIALDALQSNQNKVDVAELLNPNQECEFEHVRDPSEDWVLLEGLSEQQLKEEDYKRHCNTECD
jgi:hypothetical protein